MNPENHWNKIYTHKQLSEVSWYQPSPTLSLDFVNNLSIPKEAAIIDVGGGDSLLVDHLLALGYFNITVLDISASAIERAKKRLGAKATRVTWIVSDILDFMPVQQYDYWHDRAAFHFLTRETEVKAYLAIAGKALKANGKLVIGTFSENGPEKCSGLPVKKYSENMLTGTLKKFFAKIKCVYEDHQTPFNTIQQFIFCSFNRIPA